MEPEIALSAAIDHGQHVRQGRPDSLLRIHVEWDAEPSWRLLRQLGAIRFELEDIFERPVTLRDSGPGCFYARFELHEGEHQGASLPASRANTVQRLLQDDEIRDSLSEMRERHGISRLQIIAPTLKITVF